MSAGAEFSAGVNLAGALVRQVVMHRTRIALRPSALLGSLAAVALLGLAACSDDGGSSNPLDNLPGITADGGDGGVPTLNLETPDATFTALPGKVRFANFVSDGTAGVDIDVYWGSSPEDGQLLGTIGFGTVSEFTTPMHTDFGFADDDEASWSFVRTGGTTREDMIGGGDESFTADSVFTVGISAAKPLPSQPGLNLSTQIFYENELSVPPAGFAHVYAWDGPWQATIEGAVGVLGSSATCFFDRGEATGGNVGEPNLVPAGTTGLAIVDANTVCATGATPSADVVEAGRSYVAIGVAPTTDPAARTTVLLPIGV
ncbi:MAG: hypothetical protein ABMA25_03125 [Ilumatobacteraceae bacterium]